MLFLSHYKQRKHVKTMINISELTTIFFQVDEFCKEFSNHLNTIGLEEFSDKKRRNKPPKLSDSEIITILIFFHACRFRDLKSFYLGYVCQFLKTDFPKTVSYNRFTELCQKATPVMLLYLKMKRLGDCTGVSFVDSTSLTVCHNKRIHQHKTFKDFAQRGHTSVGYFFGFKLHICINDKGELLEFAFTKGNTDDRNPKVMDSLTDAIFGKLYADRGYISKALFQKLFDSGIHLITKVKKNMKNQFISLRDKILLRKRAVIESVYDELKNLCQIEHTRHRSMGNFLSNLFSGLIAYSFFPKKPSLNLDFETSNQLTLF